MNITFLYNNNLINTKFVFKFLIILIWLNDPIISIKYFKAFTLLSKDIIIISDEGLYKYEIENKNQKIISDIESIASIMNVEYISFAQFPSNEGGYILCRINNYILILSEDSEEIIGEIIIDEIKEEKLSIIPYTTKDNKKSFILCFVNFNYKIVLIMYEINFEPTFNTKQLFKNEQDVKYEDETVDYLSGRPITCELMLSENKDNILVCFVITGLSKKVNAVAFDPGNNCKLLYFFKNEVVTAGVNIFSSKTSMNRDKSLVCYIDTNNVFYCLIYNSEKKEWSQIVKYFDSCLTFQNNKGIAPMTNKQNFLINCYKDTLNLLMIELDENFSIKEIDGEECIFEYKFEECFQPYSSSLLYNETNQQYILSLSCAYIEDVFRIYELDKKCSSISQIPNFTYINNNEITSSSSSSILLTSTSTSSSFKSTTLSTSAIFKHSSTLINTIPSSYKLSTSPKLSTFIPSSSKLSTSSTFIPYSSKLSKFSTISNFIPSSSSTFISITHSKNSLSTSKTTFMTYSSSFNYILDDFDFYYEEGIIKGKTNKTKEDIQNNLDNIIKIIEIGKKYEINGDDYNILISSVNAIDTFNSSYVEFSICEQILRKKCNISQEKILTILQVEIERKNEKCLTNQIEYEIYDEEKNKLDLSYCKDVSIKVNYEIKDSSLINKTMISYYSNLNIDIYNIEDSFFNDICYPFSDYKSDIILKDRVLDIYQNYSLCESGCNYDKIDIESMTVTCSCEVKTEVDAEESEPVFGKIIENSFKDSNFGVILCYNLVFNFKTKLQNYGFIIFLQFVLIHILLFVWYLISGINSIILFVHKEMEKYNYTLKTIHSPIKKNSNKNFLSELKEKDLRKSKTIKIKSKKKEDLNSSSKTKIGDDNQNLKDIYIKNKKLSKVNIVKQNIKISKPIVVLKYNIHSYSSKKSLKDLYKGNKNKKLKVENNSKKKLVFNEENKNFPGYYDLIQIDANNQKNNEPPSSKYILDNYIYETAIKYDNREFWRIYYIILLSKENFLNTFFFKSPLERQPLRLSLFIFSYSCDFALNALFYLNENISDKYHYQGENLYFYTLINNLTISIFSTVFSYLLIKLLGCLTNSKDSIENLFRNQEELLRKNKKYKVKRNDKQIIYEKLRKIFKILKIKIVCYIIIESFLLLFFFYYVTAFCEVYKSTQSSWLSDSYISFLFSFPIELSLSFFYAVFYMISIKYKLKALYNIALFGYGLG